jgi:hypothetical protein
MHSSFRIRESLTPALLQAHHTAGNEVEHLRVPGNLENEECEPTIDHTLETILVESVSRAKRSVERRWIDRSRAEYKHYTQVYNIVFYLKSASA